MSSITAQLTRGQDGREALGFPPVLADGENDELAENKIVAADIPARLESDLVVDVTDRSHALHVVMIEAAVEQPPPVRSLRRLEARNIASDHAREGRLPGDVLIESIEQLRQRRFGDLPEFTEQFAGLVVDAHETHPDFPVLRRIGGTRGDGRMRHGVHVFSSI